MACRETDPSSGLRASIIGSGIASHSVPSHTISTATASITLLPSTSITVQVPAAAIMLGQGREVRVMREGLI